MPTSMQSPRSGLAAFGAALLVALPAATMRPTAARADGKAAAPSAAVTTQACLGDFATFLTCPAGASVHFGSECRAKEQHGGQAAGEHWSGSQRQGPALFFRGTAKQPAKDAKVSFAANYKNHKKNGRIYRFDKEGRLASWENVIDDRSYGLAVTCNPDGTVAFLANFAADKVVGISRSWRKDGSLSYAIDHDPDGKRTTHLEPGAGLTPELVRRPDELCRPARCDIHAKPELSAMPKGVSVPAQP